MFGQIFGEMPDSAEKTTTDDEDLKEEKVSI